MGTRPRRLGGRYELGELLGTGGMAEVYRAHDRRLGRTVAIKTLRSDLAADPGFVSWFQREAQAVAALNHPSIVAVHDSGQEKIDGRNIPYLVMEYVDGLTLSDWLYRKGGALPPWEALRITSGVLAALVHSHKAGIVHRDIKPGNVMLTSSGAVKVTDFGIARPTPGSVRMTTAPDAVAGTVAYLSPEQARGEPVDARSDLYSTGCLLYELLTRRPPFTGESPVDVAYQHIHAEPTPPSRLNPEVGPEVDAIVLKALAKDPAGRYPDAEAMRTDAERVLDGATPLYAMASAVPPASGPAGVATAGTAQEAAAPWAAPGAAIGVEASPSGPDSPTVFLPPDHPPALSPPAAAFPNGAPRDGGPPRPASSTSAPPVGRRGRTKRPAGARRWARRLVYVLLAAALVAFLGVLLVSGLRIGKGLSSLTDLVGPRPGPGQVAVPSLTGMDLDDAVGRIKEAKLSLGSVQHASASQAPGTVFKTDPAVGTVVQKGTGVTVWVSDGPGRVQLPENLADLPLGTVRKFLGDVGLVQDEKAVPSGEPAGKLVSVSPEPGTWVDHGTRVTLEVSCGKERRC